ncbi:MAG: hypothetical protein ABFS56_34475, partial [Pseudomonadota bacterium]
ITPTQMSTANVQQRIKPTRTNLLLHGYVKRDVRQIESLKYQYRVCFICCPVERNPIFSKNRISSLL